MKNTVLDMFSEWVSVVSVTSSEEISTKRAERAEKRSQKRSVEKMLCECSPSESSEVDTSDGGGMVTQLSASNEERSDGGLLQNESRSPTPCKDCQEIRESLSAQISKLQDEVQQWRTSYVNLKEKNSEHAIDTEVNTKVNNILKPFFTQTQIDAIINNRKTVKHWPEDIASAMTLKSLSPKCYRYLRNVKGFPLPSETTLKDRTRNFTCEPGILSSVLQLMKSKSDTIDAKEKLVVMCLDEMSISKQWSYDKGTDTLYKPHKYVQVVMLRSLVGQWKQPIYFQFDDSKMHDIVLDLIEKVEAVGYQVIGIVHDLGPTNLRLWKTLGIDPVKTNKVSFKNPCADREVFLFADVPHMIKLIRNNLLDSGFVLENGDTVSDECIREMLVKTKTEYGLAYKVSDVHLNVVGQQRQRVKYATQLLSKSCASAIQYLGERGLLTSKNWKATANFLSFADQWFDVMNSHMYGDKQQRCAFGMHLELQEDILLRMVNLMSTMRVKNSRSLYAFQKGIILSCKSLIGLFEMLKQSHQLDFIMTRRLNQDCLENLFGCIRQMGSTHDHPDAVSFKYRLKKIMLGREVALVSEKSNVSQNEELCDSFLAKVPSKTQSKSDSRDRELALEICLTSLLFKDMELDTEAVGDEVSVDLHENQENMENVNVLESASTVIEEQSLQYIGGYIVKKFSMKYPNLGHVAENCGSPTNSWTEMISRGHLYMPSDSFSSQLSTMRAVFKAVHGEELRAGTECVQTLTAEMERAGVHVSSEVIAFFARISIFFRMRHLNKMIKQNKQKRQNALIRDECRGMARKKMKMIT